MIRYGWKLENLSVYQKAFTNQTLNKYSLTGLEVSGTNYWCLLNRFLNRNPPGIGLWLKTAMPPGFCSRWSGGFLGHFQFNDLVKKILQIHRKIDYQKNYAISVKNRNPAIVPSLKNSSIWGKYLLKSVHFAYGFLGCI